MRPDAPDSQVRDIISEPSIYHNGAYSAWWRAHGPWLRRLQVPGAGRRGVGCRGARDRITSPYLFLVVTAVGVALAVSAMLQNRQIVTFIDVDMAGQEVAPPIPGENWAAIRAWIAIILGTVSFSTLLFVA